MSQIALAVLIAGLLPIVCAATAKWGMKNYDNHNPRAWLLNQEGFRARANAAQQNSFEAFPFFLGGVVIAHLAGVAETSILTSAWIFVTFRVAYIACYIANWALLRSIVWTIAWLAVLRLYLAAIA